MAKLKFEEDFKVGFSPERINPGDQNHTLTKIVKVTSGSDSEAAENIAKTYELIIEAGVYRASSIKVAESAKIIEKAKKEGCGSLRFSGARAPSGQGPAAGASRLRARSCQGRSRKYPRLRSVIVPTGLSQLRNTGAGR
jgi:hypothetical protein